MSNVFSLFQFGLVCHQERWMELLHLVLSTASSALAVILSGLADHLGRKAVLLFSVTMSVLGSVINYFSPDIVAYIVLRCLTHGFILVRQILSQWQIQGGARDRLLPYWSNFFHFRAVFGKKKLAK